MDIVQKVHLYLKDNLVDGKYVEEEIAQKAIYKTLSEIRARVGAVSLDGKGAVRLKTEILSIVNKAMAQADDE